MGYARGRFGVEYQPHGNTETHRLRWFVGIVTLLVLAAFTWYRLSHRTPAPKPPREADARAPVAVSDPVGTPTPRARPEAVTTAKPPAPSAVLTNAPRRTAVRTPPTKQTPQVLRLVESWLATASTRSEKEQVLLQRLAEAERQGNVPLAIDSLKNGQFFRRYILSIAKSTPCSVYPISPESGATVHARFRELGIRASSPDRAELDLFLAPGSRITVAEQ